MQVVATQLHFLANRNAGLAIPQLFWPVNRIKIGGHVALLSCPTVHSLYCEMVENLNLFCKAKTVILIVKGYSNKQNITVDGQSGH